MSSVLSLVLEQNTRKLLKQEIEFHSDGLDAEGVAFVEMVDTEYGIDISVDFEAEVFLTCSRCLDEYSEKQIINHQIIIARTSDGWEVDDETLEMNIVDLEQSTFDLRELLRQLLIERQEMRPLCREDCKGLCPICGVNLNHEKCDCVVEVVDPRWAKLKSLDISKEEV